MRQDAKILIIDDEEDILVSLKMLLSQHFLLVDTENNPFHIPRLIRHTDYDLILLDMNFRRGDTSGKDGLEWLSKILELKPEASVVMITAYADVNMAVEAIKAGALDFIEKPWRNDKLLNSIRTAIQIHLSKKKLRPAKSVKESSPKTLAGKPGIIGHSPPMQRVYSLVKKVACTDADVLVLGENGTGKELIARSIHDQSPRAGGPFVNVDMGAIPETLFESELFGHKKGAFTDAREDRPGRFEAASGGTLFLDEIGNLSLPLQAKLLAALQNRQILRVGSNAPIPVDIRLICATNMPLHQMVQENAFRQDLLFRINTVEISLPSLRERKEDIAPLIEHYLEIYAQKYQRKGLIVHDSALKALQHYSWPGNIRELRHAVERAVILAESDILQTSDFVLQSFATAESTEYEPVVETFNLADLEKWAIEKAIEKHQGNISKAADELGITRAALYRRLSKHDI